MNPLFRLKQAQETGLLPVTIVKKIIKRMKYVEEGVARIEKASGLNYPSYYIEPALTLSSTNLEIGQLGVMYARTFPTKSVRGFEILVQLTAPLVAFAQRNTIHAVLAHEFLHYIEYARRFIKFSFTSDELTGSIYESLYSDIGRLYDPKHILKDRGLIRLLKTRFEEGLKDEKLNQKTERMWIEKGYPSITLSPESNVLRIPIELILTAEFDSRLKTKLEELDRVSVN